MTVLVCVDENGGMLFNKRRQSRDGAVCADIIRTCGTVRMNAYSAKLFSDYTDQIVVCEDVPQKGAACFVEDRQLAGLEIDTLILYRWNRRYPADVFLDVRPDGQGRVLTLTEEFPGSSHDRITKEIWRKEHGKTEEP